MRKHPLAIAVECAAFVALHAAAGGAPGTDAPTELLVRIGDKAASNLVERSVLGAIERLTRSASCRLVLHDFQNSNGQSLAQVLEARGDTPGRHLAGLLYLDGRAHPHCRSGRVLAYTAPGWRVVYVCAAEFRRRLERRAAEAEAVLIHEALHTLGLGENPPTPRAIQDHVRARCLAARPEPAPPTVGRAADR